MYFPEWQSKNLYSETDAHHLQKKKSDCSRNLHKAWDKFLTTTSLVSRPRFLLFRFFLVFSSCKLRRPDISKSYFSYFTSLLTIECLGPNLK